MCGSNLAGLTLMYIALTCVAAVVSRPAWRMLVLLMARYVQQFNKRTLFFILLLLLLLLCGLCAGSSQRAARITMWTTTMLDIEGTNAVLFCRSEGNPRPTVTWIDRDDRRIDSDRDQYLVRI